MYVFNISSAYENPVQPHGIFIWLGIKNDYRTLIGLDEIDIVVQEDDEDWETDDV